MAPKVYDLSMPAMSSQYHDLKMHYLLWIGVATALAQSLIAVVQQDSSFLTRWCQEQHMMSKVNKNLFVS